MTGVNKIHAKWVSKKELDRRRKEAECIRCGKKGHRVAQCQSLPPLRPESSIKSAIITEEDAEKEEICSDIDSLKG